MNRNNEMPSDDLRMPSGCQFRIWNRAELQVDDACVVMEGLHACLMLELLRNIERRVPCSTLWAIMQREGTKLNGERIEDAVRVETRRIRYALSTKGILAAIDDSEPERGFMLSTLCRLSENPKVPARKRPHRMRRSQKGPVAEISRHRTRHIEPVGEVPCAVAERLEKRTARSAGEST